MRNAMINYDLKLKEIIASLKDDEVPTLLLHACCGPCSSYVLSYLTNYFNITILYYNPNIYPDEEYQRRKDEAKRLINEMPFKYPVKFIETDYNPDEFYRAIKGKEKLGERSLRCFECYKLRLEKTALYAKENGYDYFTTTLSISPYKNATWINEIGEDLQKKYDIKYLYGDFKKNDGYKKSLEYSREYNLYRQDYCGCVYSKEERLNH